MAAVVERPVSYGDADIVALFTGAGIYGIERVATGSFSVCARRNARWWRGA